jgi:hypothetical protein
MGRVSHSLTRPDTTDFDPLTLTTRYLYFRMHPRRMQAWREADELEARELTRCDRSVEA